MIEALALVAAPTALATIGEGALAAAAASVAVCNTLVAFQAAQSLGKLLEQRSDEAIVDLAAKFEHDGVTLAEMFAEFKNRFWIMDDGEIKSLAKIILDRADDIRGFQLKLILANGEKNFQWEVLQPE
jgi:hypothetical protein